LKFLVWFQDPLTDEQKEARFAQAKDAARSVIKRAFVVMSAQNKGWAFAKDLDFLQEGTLSES